MQFLRFFVPIRGLNKVGSILAFVSTPALSFPVSRDMMYECLLESSFSTYMTSTKRGANSESTKALYLTIHTFFWSISLFYFIVTIYAATMCSPRQKIWAQVIATGHCFSTNTVVMSTGIFNVISDFAILILPVFPIWKVQLPPKKKLGIAAIFSTGIW